MKIAIVTGASSGMGKEFIKKIMKEEAAFDEIWVIARRRERLEKWQNLYKKQSFRILPIDLSVSDGMEVLKAELQKESPEIACFIHCAGFGIYGQIAEIPAKEQAQMIDINCRCVVELTSMLVPLLTEDAKLIYMASSAGFLPQPGFATYSASKAFVVSFVRAFRAENKKKSWKVTAVCPGAVKTEFFNRAAKDVRLPVYKQMVMADPKKVVAKAWKDNHKGKAMSVYGLPIKTFWLASKLLPHSLFLHFMG